MLLLQGTFEPKQPAVTIEAFQSAMRSRLKQALQAGGPGAPSFVVLFGKGRKTLWSVLRWQPMRNRPTWVTCFLDLSLDPALLVPSHSTMPAGKTTLRLACICAKAVARRHCP